MSDPRQDQERPLDPAAALATEWRRASRDEPPAHVDARILAAARAAVAAPVADAKPGARSAVRSRDWFRWQPLLAAAAVGGIAFAILPALLRQDMDVPPRGVESKARVPAPAPAEATALAPAQSAADHAAVTPGGTSARGVARSPVRAEAAGPLPVEPDSPSSTPGMEATARSTAELESARPNEAPQVEQRHMRSEEPAPMAPAPAAAGNVTAAAESADAPLPRSQAPSQAAAAWARRIEALYESGDVAGAAAELRAFRASQADADDDLPEALQAWARTVK